jgi:hypothetical protein
VACDLAHARSRGRPEDRALLEVSSGGWARATSVQPVEPCERVRILVAKLVATAPAQGRIRAHVRGSQNAVTCGDVLWRTPKDADLFPDTEEVTGSSPVSPTHEGRGQGRSPTSRKIATKLRSDPW